MNNQYAKSAIRVYNNVAQPFTAAVTPLNIEGTPVVQSGCALKLHGKYPHSPVGTVPSFGRCNLCSHCSGCCNYTALSRWCCIAVRCWHPDSYG